MVFILFSAAFVVITVFYLTVSLRILVFSKPTVLSSSLVIAFLGLLIIPFSYQVLSYLNRNSLFSWIGLAGPVLYLALLVFYIFVLKGYTFYGIGEEDFRTSLRQALNEAGLSFEEKIGKIELTNTEMSLHYTYNLYSGTGLLRFQKARLAEDRVVAKKVLTEFCRYYADNKVKTRKGVGVLYLVFSVVLTVLTGQLIGVLLRQT